MNSDNATAGLLAGERTSLSEKIYQQLRSMILGRELAPGSVVTERRLAEAIAISRTPLRSAISRLEGEGLVERLANNSVMIRNFSVHELLEILLIRRLLESEAAAHAAGQLPVATLEALEVEARHFAEAPEADVEAFWRHDDVFHGTIARAAGKPILAALIEDLRGKARMCHLRRMPRTFQAQGREHLALIDALARGDADAARNVMAIHLGQVRQRLLSWLGV